MVGSFWPALVPALLALGLLVGVCGGDDKRDLEARVEQLETQIKSLLAGAYLVSAMFLQPIFRLKYYTNFNSCFISLQERATNTDQGGSCRAGGSVMASSNPCKMGMGYPEVPYLSYSQRKKILVTGGAGFVGSHLTDRLLMQVQIVVEDQTFLSNKMYGLTMIIFTSR